MVSGGGAQATCRRRYGAPERSRDGGGKDGPTGGADAVPALGHPPQASGGCRPLFIYTLGLPASSMGRKCAGRAKSEDGQFVGGGGEMTLESPRHAGRRAGMRRLTSGVSGRPASRACGAALAAVAVLTVLSCTSSMPGGGGERGVGIAPTSGLQSLCFTCL